MVISSRFASSLRPLEQRIVRGRALSRTRGTVFWNRRATSSQVSVWDSFNSLSDREELPEVQAVNALTDLLLNQTRKASDPVDGSEFAASNHDSERYKHIPSKDEYLLALEASMATFALHVHARIAASVGCGYYTIGPCGEESMSTAGILLEDRDASALHYRHTAISLARQLKSNRSFLPSSPSPYDADTLSKRLQDLLLGRARGYAASKHDPVTGGVHCCIGGGDHEYVVTSTLASQCPSAVGRALGGSLLPINDDTNSLRHQRPISFVTIGDGSLHNHHFLSSWTLAQHARHKNKTRCPVVFGISDNGFSISYRTHGFVDAFFRSVDETDPLCPVFRVTDASDMLEVYSVSKEAFDYSRKHQGPSVILYQNLKRRFGHAATDRQSSYMNAEEIEEHQSTCVLQKSCVQAVEALGYTTYETLLDRWTHIQQQTEIAFETAIHEPKVTLSEMTNRVSVPLAPIPVATKTNGPSEKEINEKDPEPFRVMRKHMTRAIGEAMAEDESVVYLGEDVRHGGYYVVTEGLANKFPDRVLDFPPDETTLLGVALGFSQLGLTPIVEIPYAKYLDCGADMFNEIAIQHWLTNGNKRNQKGNFNHEKVQPGGAGMVIRLQGFDRGLFGGNFHTHNSLTFCPPGVDLVCFSNGMDWVRGFRHALWQAKHGRIVMIVDCTKLLNTRHLHESEKDRAWEFAYPQLVSGDNDFSTTAPMMGFEEVIRYGISNEGDTTRFTRERINGDHQRCPSSQKTLPARRIAIVTYGNGVVSSLQARKGLVDKKFLWTEEELDVIDCPYLSDVPKGLELLLATPKNYSSEGVSSCYDHVLFADICKEGPSSNVFSSMITNLRQKGLLPESWAFVGAPRTYNPLGSIVTFLNRDRIESAVIELAGLSNIDSSKGCANGDD